MGLGAVIPGIVGGAGATAAPLTALSAAPKLMGLFGGGGGVTPMPGAPAPDPFGGNVTPQMPDPIPALQGDLSADVVGDPFNDMKGIPSKNPAFHNTSSDMTSVMVPSRNPAFHDMDDGLQRVAMPSKNPAFHTLPEESGTPAGKRAERAQNSMFASQPVKNDVGSTQRPMRNSDWISPGSHYDRQITKSAPMNSMLDTPDAGNAQLMQKQGFDKMASVVGTPVKSGAAPSMFAEAKSAVSQTSPSPIDDSDPGDFGERIESAGLFKDQIGNSASPVQRVSAPSSLPQQPPQPTKTPGMFDGLTAGISDGVSGLQEKLKTAPQNPLFRTGMGLLASGYDGSNPYTNIMSGLTGAQQSGAAAAAAASKQAEAEKAAKLAAAEQSTMDAITAYLMGDESELEDDELSRSARGNARILKRS